MGNFYPTLGSKSLEELPAIPTNVVTTGGIGAITATWTNNNTLTGCTNVLQLWNTTLGKWEDSVSGASSATTLTKSGLVELATYNARVAVKQTSTGRYYPSLTKSVTTTDNPYPLNGLVSRWQFEDNLTDVVSGYNMALSSGSASYDNGLVGRCIVSTGNFYWNTNAAWLGYISGRTAFSMSCWAKGTFVDKMGIHLNTNISGGQLGCLYWQNATTVYPMVRDNSFNAVTVPTISSTVWQHMVYVYDGTNSKFYLNNNLIYTKSNDTTSITDFHQIRFPNTTAGNIRWDNTYFYNRVLTVAEIAKLYNAGAGI